MERIDFASIGLHASARRCRCGASMLDIGNGIDCCGNKAQPHAWKGTMALDGTPRQLAIVLRDKMVRDAKERKVGRPQVGKK